MVCRGGAANSVAMELDSGGHSWGCSPGEIAVFWETLEGQWAGGAKLGTLCAQAGAASPQAASAQKGPTSIDKRSTSTPPHRSFAQPSARAFHPFAGGFIVCNDSRCGAGVLEVRKRSLIAGRAASLQVAFSG